MLFIVAQVPGGARRSACQRRDYGCVCQVRIFLWLCCQRGVRCRCARASSSSPGRFRALQPTPGFGRG